MTSSVQGNFVDQAWAANLPGFFKDNVKPALASEAFLIPRQNDAVPDIVTRNTVGAVYNRGFIDRPVNRLETTRSFILNPSTYNARLHPHDVTSGTGGIDNLSNLYRFGHPLPFSDAEDFADLQFFAKYQKDRGLDPLTEGYAIKAIGEGGSMLASAMAQDRAALNEKLAMQKKIIDEKQKEGEEQNLDRAVLQQAYDEAARQASEEAATDPGSAMSLASARTLIDTGSSMSLSNDEAPAFTRSSAPPVEMGASPSDARTNDDEKTAENEIPSLPITLTWARSEHYNIFLAVRYVGAANRPFYHILAAPGRGTWMFVSGVGFHTYSAAREAMEIGSIKLNTWTNERVAAEFGQDAVNYQLMAVDEEVAAEQGTYIKSEPGDSEQSSVVASVEEGPAGLDPARAPTSAAASTISSLTNRSFRGAPRPIPNTLDSIARNIFERASEPSDPSSSSSSSSDASSFSDLKRSIRSQLSTEAQNAGVSNSSYWDAQMRNTQDVMDLLHLMGARSSNPAAIFSNAYSATPYFVRRTQMGLDGNYSKRQALFMPTYAKGIEPRVEQATSQSGDVFSNAEKASDPRVALLLGKRPGASTYLDPNLAADSGAFKQLEFHAGNNRFDGNIDGPSEQASLAIRNPTNARNMQGSVSREFVRPTAQNRQTGGVLGKNQRTPSATMTIANRSTTNNPVAAFRGGAAPLR